MMDVKRISPEVYMHNVLEVVACLVTGVKARRVKELPVSPHLQPWLPELVQYQDHLAFTLTTAILALGLPVNELVRFALMHVPLPTMERRGEYPSELLQKVPAKRVGEIFGCESQPAAVLDLYADALRDFWESSSLSAYLAELAEPAMQAVCEVRKLTADTDYVWEVTELLGVSCDLECHLVPVMFFASREERYGFELDLGGRTVVFLCFGYEGFDDAEVEGKSRQWLRLGCYHHLAQAILLPYFPDARQEVMRSEALVEPLRGLPSFNQYRDWYVIFSKHVVGAVSSLLEKRRIGERAYQYLARLHPGSGMLYTRFIMQELEPLLAERRPLVVTLRRLALQLFAAREELQAEATRLPFLGSIKECQMPYWASGSTPLLYVAGSDGERRVRLIEMAHRTWGEVELLETPLPELSGPPLICYGSVDDPTIRRLMAHANITVAPSFIRIGQSTYYGTHLHLLAVGQQPFHPSAWWAVHCAWEADHIQESPPLWRLGADYVVMNHGQVLGEGNYILETLNAS